MEQILYIDGDYSILGRVGTHIASKLIEGFTVELVNAEKMIISGDPKSILERYKERFKIRTKTTPWRGPFHYRRPDMFVRRTIRGMLPWKKPSGKSAYHRLRVYIGVPGDLKETEFTKIKDASASRLNKRFITVADLCRQLGWENPLKEEA
ncbi:MAG: 50S ribosomal protein L13 [Candidatus Ranarchaeia archaeon]